MFRRLTIWREEMNLIGQFFLVGSLGKHVMQYQAIQIGYLSGRVFDSKALFPLSQLRSRQPPFSSQNKAISVKDDCSTL